MSCISNCPKIAYADIADPRLGSELKNKILNKGIQFIEALKENNNIDVVVSKNVISTEKEAKEFLEAYKNSGCCGLLLRLAWFNRSNTPVALAQFSSLPCMLLAFKNPNDTAFEGFALAHGALDEVGLEHEAHFGDVDNETVSKVNSWTMACYAKQKFSGAVYGEMGGRSLEMIPASSDYNQLRKIFGMHVDHLEQRELIERAKTVANEKTLQTINEWKKLFPNIDCSYEALDKSARIYLAGKEIFKEKDWSFAGIQCQPDMIDNYLAPCLPVAMWNEDGFIASCENDINNALGMYLARSITGKPSMFADIFHLDKKTKTVHVLNCGTAAPYIAGGPDNILLKDQTPLQGSWDEKSNCSLCKGGVCTQFIMPKGKVTIIRFGRINGKYVIHLSRAEALEHEYNPDELEGIASIWPFAYIKLQMEDIESFIGNMRSHHAVIVPEDCYESIQIFANLLKITLL